MVKLILTFFYLTLFFSCSKNKDQLSFVFEHDGIAREYILYIPNTIKPQAPLIFVLHGLGSTNSHIRDYSQMDLVANKNGFVVCYPQGTGSTKNTIHTKKGSSFWNVGYEIHKNEVVDDVSFLTSLAIYLQQEYDLDPEKTFCTGMSNGGDMSYLLGCQAPEVFKAIASITGCMMEWIYKSCDNKSPIPVFQIHGTKDNITYYDGDIKNRDRWGAYLGVESTIQFWVDHNMCSKSIIDTIGFVNNESRYIIREKFLNGIDENEVWLYKVIDGGHDWVQKSLEKDFNTSEEIWKFFEHLISLRSRSA
tara:strand:+ start:1575 stop:2492 length:918 start_codon:yes stop_codon:yes gene_type:complete